jgi:hypothetical protein
MRKLQPAFRVRRERRCLAISLSKDAKISDKNLNSLQVDAEVIAVLRNSSRVTPRAVASELQKFNRFALELEIDVSLVLGRRVVEMFARSLCGLHKIPNVDRAETLLGKLKAMSVIDGAIYEHCKLVKDFGNQAAHALADGVQRFSNTELIPVINSINVVFSWYVHVVLPRLPEERAFRVVDGDSVTEAHLTEVTEIEKLAYEQRFRASAELLWRWHARNHDIFTLVEDTTISKIVGCLTVLPLSDAQYDRMEAGLDVDVEMSASEILNFDLPGFYNLYVAAVIVDPAYRGTDAFRQMYNSYLNKVSHLAYREIFVRELLADAITEDGLALVKWLGMKRVTDTPTEHGSSIYKAILLPPNIKSPFQDLIRDYRAFAA